jgi:uncharacterized protein (TIGR02453 family)
MIEKNTTVFLKNLKAHNNKQWLDANRPKYEAAKENFADMVTELITQIGKLDTGIASLTAKECTFRLNRDIRFSKDKSPYKTNFGASFSLGGKKAISAGYYFHLEPGKSFIGGGLWMPSAAELFKIRQEIDYNFADWKKIINNKSFKTNFVEGLSTAEKLSRVPKGYSEDNPAIEFIKLKSFVTTKPLSDAEILSPELIKQLTTACKSMKPIIDFINKAIV